MKSYFSYQTNELSMKRLILFNEFKISLNSLLSNRDALRLKKLYRFYKKGVWYRLLIKRNIVF